MTPRAGRIIGIVAFFAIGAVILSLYFIFDPAESILAPKCIFHSVTGWECPGCGSQRMIHALLHGDLSAAWNANPFLLCASPLLALVAFAAIYRTRLPKLYAAVNSMPSIILIAVVITLWTVARNVFPLTH